MRLMQLHGIVPVGVESKCMNGNEAKLRLQTGTMQLGSYMDCFEV